MSSKLHDRQSKSHQSSNIIVVLGTDHNFQWGRLRTSEFKDELNRLIQKYDIKLIADEINDKPSVVNNVAEDTGIDYVVIEPTREEKSELKIEEQHQILYELSNKFGLHGNYDVNTWPEDNRQEYESRLEQTYRQREAEWLNRIQQAKLDPVLVVFGAAHFDEFSKLLEQSGYTVIKENSFWGKEYL